MKKPQIQGLSVTLKLSGLHCTSCAMNIDAVLEELEGIYTSDTSYANSETTVVFDDAKVSVEEIITEIRAAGYEAQLEPTAL